jgi:hypothetical protein
MLTAGGLIAIGAVAAVVAQQARIAPPSPPVSLGAAPEITVYKTPT